MLGSAMSPEIVASRICKPLQLEGLPSPIPIALVTKDPPVHRETIVKECRVPAKRRTRYVKTVNSYLLEIDFQKILQFDT